MQQIRIGSKYSICKQLGAGAFGELYQGIDVRSNEKVAIKLEPADCKMPMLEYEATLCKKFQGLPGFSNIYWHGQEGNYFAMIMELQGPSLYHLFKFCNQRFGLKTLLWIAIQMIQRIETLHKTNYIHRDIKPENFLIGSTKRQNIVYIIDFGLSKRYIDPKTGQHIHFKKRNSPTGTLRYCSLSAHQSKEQSRRDDLESIGHVLLYFLKEGTLPWMNIEEFTIQKQIDAKASVDYDKFLKNDPPCFLKFMTYVKNLGFSDEPDYKYLCSLFESEAANRQIDLRDNRFEWIEHKERVIDEKLAKEKELIKRSQKETMIQTKQKTAKTDDLEFQSRLHKHYLNQKALLKLKREELQIKQQREEASSKHLSNQSQYDRVSTEQAKLSKRDEVQAKIERAMRIEEFNALPRQQRMKRRKEMIWEIKQYS